MAYIQFGKSCLSAGFLSAGRILRGWNNFVGELGLLPVDESTTLDELLASPIDNDRYSRIAAKLLSGICCILNPEYIALGGENFRRDCLPLITEYFDHTLPESMSAKIVYAEVKWHDYFLGMAYLTAEQIFSDVQVVFGTAFTFLTSGVFLSGLAMYMGASDLLVSYIRMMTNICGISIIFFSSFIRKVSQLQKDYNEPDFSLKINSLTGAYPPLGHSGCKTAET